MKKFLALLLAAMMVFAFTACGGGGSSEEAADSGSEDAAAAASYDDIDDNCESEDGTYEVAMVTDVGQLKDGSFNQFTWNGVKKYAYDNGLTYKYYQPANAANATDEDRMKAMRDAADAGAKVIVTTGFMQATALETVAPEYPDVQFIFVDGGSLGQPNVIGITYKEEQAGYLAGYATVMEGYTKLGFSGGGGGTNPACIRYGYGFAQGANDAAKEKDVEVEMRYSWEYGSQFQASDDLQAMLAGWYNAGTEAIFMCGGTMFNSGTAAADAADGAIIGVDVDQSPLSDTVITSAMKDLAGSVIQTIGEYYADSAVKGEDKVLGAADDMVGLPTDTWSLQNWSVEDYNALFEKVKSGEITIDDNAEMADPSTAGLEKIKFVK